jgi:hypothetical protein
MTTQDLTTAFGQYLGPIVLLLALFKFTDWPLWLMLLVGIPGGVLIGVVSGILLAKALERLAAGNSKLDD